MFVLDKTVKREKTMFCRDLKVAKFCYPRLSLKPEPNLFFFRRFLGRFSASSIIRWIRLPLRIQPLHLIKFVGREKQCAAMK